MSNRFGSLALAGITALLSSPIMAKPNTYHIDIWADNWVKAYLNGEVLVEDSTPITTERSFNREPSPVFSRGRFCDRF